MREEIDEFVLKLKEENLSDEDIEKKVKEKYMPKIYEQYVNRNRVYVRSLVGLDVELSVIEAGICKDAKKCLHPYLNKWDGEYLCMDCWKKLNTYDMTTGISTPEEGYAERIAQEEELENNTPVDRIPEALSGKERNDVIGKNSSMRGRCRCECC